MLRASVRHTYANYFRKHQIEMETGWQGISSFVTPLSSSFEILMTQISNQLAIAQNMLETYWPEYGINTINDFPIKMVIKSN